MTSRLFLLALASSASVSWAVPVIRQIERPTEIKPPTDKLVVRSQLAVLAYFFERRGSPPTVFADGYGGRGPVNRATILGMRAAFDGRPFPKAVTELTERQRTMLLVNGGTHVALALGLIRDVRPLHDRGSKARRAMAAIFARVRSGSGSSTEVPESPAYDRELLDRIAGESAGPVAIVLPSSGRFEGDDVAYVDLPSTRGFAEFEAARTRPVRSKPAGCNYHLSAPTEWR